MIDKIKEHIAHVEAFSAATQAEVEDFRIKYLGSKGLLKEFFAEFKNVANDQKKEFGQVVNTLKNAAQDKVTILKESLDTAQEVSGAYGDLSRPGEPVVLGSRHP
ncbi:MAG: phenylalanyl-tRNA synthetase alpha chain, partial [Patiriisocius sp.]